MDQSNHCMTDYGAVWYSYVFWFMEIKSLSVSDAFTKMETLIILTKFPTLGVLEIVIVTTSGATKW